ncbi:MAG: twin-arginine translocase subunit TatC [Rhodobacteraceae bacterium]|nr:MAG: twin-arginine translocase subunit TatC [Paracoccaceae bacterium]
MKEEKDDVDESAAPLIEHLTELRSRLIRSVVAFALCMIAAFTVATHIFNFLANPIVEILKENGQSPDLIFTGLQQGFMVNIRISLFGGFMVSFPYISFQLWKFVAPGLYKNEKRAFLPFLLASPLLFLLGASFAFYIVMPLAFDFFLGFQQENTDVSDLVGITYLGTINEYLGLTMKFIIAFGLCFQLPVLLTLMGKVGLISSEVLAKSRKYAVVGILVLAAIVTPPDVITQIILFTVVYALYEVSVLLVKWVEKKKEKDFLNEDLNEEDSESSGAKDQ